MYLRLFLVFTRSDLYQTGLMYCNVIYPANTIYWQDVDQIFSRKIKKPLNKRNRFRGVRCYFQLGNILKIVKLYELVKRWLVWKCVFSGKERENRVLHSTINKNAFQFWYNTERRSERQYVCVHLIIPFRAHDGGKQTG